MPSPEKSAPQAPDVAVRIIPDPALAPSSGKEFAWDPWRSLADFTARAEAENLGAVASFVGLVRARATAVEKAAAPRLSFLVLEHYPGMTERAVKDLVKRAAARWPLLSVLVEHRAGRLLVGEPIVLVATASAHRDAALSSCGFLIDGLKTSVPLWKCEKHADGASYWLAPTPGDIVRNESARTRR